MSHKLIEEINKFSSFRYDETTKRVRNTKAENMANIEEFLEIAYILDNHHIRFEMGNNYSMKIIGKR